MSLVSSPSALIDRDEHNDSWRNQGKNDVEGYLFAVCKHHVAKDTPQKSDTYGLTICNLSACHSLQLFSWMKQASRSKWPRPGIRLHFFRLPVHLQRLPCRFRLSWQAMARLCKNDPDFLWTWCAYPSRRFSWLELRKYTWHSILCWIRKFPCHLWLPSAFWPSWFCSKSEWTTSRIFCKRTGSRWLGTW